MKNIVNRIRDILLPYGTRRRDFAKKVYKKLLKQQGIDENKALYKKTSGSESLNYGLWDFRINEELVILTTQHCLFIANLMKKCCEKVGLSAKVITEKPQEGYKNLPHIVICPQMFKELPKLYAAFQMEQTVSSRWLTDEYYDVLNNAVAVFDYSIYNIEFFQVNNKINAGKFFYLPIAYDNSFAKGYSNIEKEYDVVFYGDDNCDRRKRMLDELKKYYNVKVINDLFGDELYKELSKSRIVINIHYYEGALLETTRIFECLSLGKAIIISEESVDIDEHESLKDIVDFVKIGDIDSIVKKIGRYLSDDKLYNEKLNKLAKYVNTKNATAFQYYFFRFLLATDNISFDTFYDEAASFINFKSKFWCLGLPEYIHRKKAFDEINQYKIEYYPGLRHFFGWVGCGLSYKFLLRKARELKLPYVTICEDDVLFRDDFNDKIKLINEFVLTKEQDWDIFSGLIADVNKNTVIESIQTYKGLEFIKIDKMTSTVFNIYNNRFMTRLENWDSNNRNADVNTIDRYIESHSSIKIITLLPFLVGCQDELQSTLWGFQNTQYNDMISNSIARLSSKVEQYKKDL